MITINRRAYMKKKKYKPILMQESGVLYDQLEMVTSDPQGSYTGIPLDPMEIPVQDADDL
jgi:hypothetical protein